MKNLDSLLKSRDITLLTKSHIVKAMVFCSRIWELDHKEEWVLKNWCFWTVVLEKTLESSLDCKEIKPLNPEGSQSWILIGRTDAEAETLFGHLMWRVNSLEKNLMLGKIEGRRRRGRQMMSWLYSITDSIDMSLSNLQEIVKDREGWHAAVHGVTKSQTATGSARGDLTITGLGAGEEEGALWSTSLSCLPRAPDSAFWPPGALVSVLRT